MVVWGLLVNHGFDYSDGDTEWEETSPAQCGACGFEGTVKDFEFKEDESNANETRFSSETA
jgi:hypothetical protein